MQDLFEKSDVLNAPVEAFYYQPRNRIFRL